MRLSRPWRSALRNESWHETTAREARPLVAIASRASVCGAFFRRGSSCVPSCRAQVCPSSPRCISFDGDRSTSTQHDGTIGERVARLVSHGRWIYRRCSTSRNDLVRRVETRALETNPGGNVYRNGRLDAPSRRLLFLKEEAFRSFFRVRQVSRDQASIYGTLSRERDRREAHVWFHATRANNAGEI